MNSDFWGRWDRNRTCTLRLWSLLPFVQGRSRTYTNTLEIAHFVGPKCQEVHQRSPALGSQLGSNQASGLAPTCPTNLGRSLYGHRSHLVLTIDPPVSPAEASSCAVRGVRRHPRD